MLRLTAKHVQTLNRYAEEEYPYECCGILVGKQNKLIKIVSNIFSTKNSESRQQNRYEINPEQHLEIHKKVRDLKKEIIGYYHSHPEAIPNPSSIDVEKAFSGYSFVIISIFKKQKEKPEFSVLSWIWDELNSHYIEEPIIIQ